jgi:hypothetical protein
MVSGVSEQTEATRWQCGVQGAKAPGGSARAEPSHRAASGATYDAFWFRPLVSRADWQRLPEPVRVRFSRPLADDGTALTRDPVNA